MNYSIRMKQEINQFLNYKETRLSPESIKAYENDLKLFNSFLNSKAAKGITPQDIESFLKYIKERSQSPAKNTNANVARKLSTLRSFFKYLVLHDVITIDPTQKVEGVRVKNKTSEFLSEEETKAFIRSIETTATPYYKARDLAIVQVLLNTGIRLKELIGLRLDDINLEQKRMVVTRKGGNEQTIFLNDVAIQALHEYLNVRIQSESPYVFLSKRNSPTQRGFGISSSEIYRIIKKYMKRAGINKKRVGVHSLRHTFASNLQKNGVHIVKIQKLLGHKNITTTQRYVHVDESDLINAVNLLNI